MTITSQIYVTKGKTESLLGKEDTIKLGILKLNQDSEGPEKELRLRCIMSEILKDTVTTWPVTGGKPQNKIDAKMAKITTKHTRVFEGMGCTNMDPIHIQIKENITLITQGNTPSRTSSRNRSKRRSNT